MSDRDIPSVALTDVGSRLVVFQVTVAPSRTYRREDFEQEEDERVPGSETTAASPSPGPDDMMARGLEANLTGKTEVRDRVVGVMDGQSASRQITSTWFA